ncbi:MAG TPA: hypothetical protein ENN81_01805 [Phycisphaerales bacterium]|nr:hypothetical protein [Phycisphaerales bacterium]
MRHKLDKAKVPGEDTLRKGLIRELKKPKTRGEPDIVIEKPYPATVHLYVIWSKWEKLDHAARSRIILDAYTEVMGEKEALKVTVAMGLTRVEATGLGIK